MSRSQGEQQPEQQIPAMSATVQQSDNITHALAGAGGGILSMVLTYADMNTLVFPHPSILLSSIPQIPFNNPVHKGSGRVQTYALYP